MINVSNALFRAMQSNTAFEEHLTIKFANGTTKVVPQSDLMLDSNGFTSGAGESTLPIGVAAGRILNISLANQSHQYSAYDFFGAEISLEVRYSLTSSNTERFSIGTFYVIEPAVKGSVLKVSAVDAMYKADKEYSTTLSFPATIQAILSEACSKCGIPLESATIPNGTYQVKTKPEDCTFRQVIGWVAMLAGGNAIINRAGRLEIKRYDLSQAHEALQMDGGVYYPWLTAYAANGGTYNPWNTTETKDGGTFAWDRTAFHVLSQWLDDPEVGTDDVVVTGVGVDMGDNTSVLSGTKDYAIYVENPLIEGDEQNGLDTIAGSIVGMQFRPFKGKTIGNPTIEFMDPCVVATPSGQTYASFVSDLQYTFRGGTEVECNAEPKLETGSTYSVGSSARQASRREAKRLLTAYDIGVQNLGDLMARSMGYYKTVEEQDDGSIISYIHDKPTLAQSLVIYKMTADGYAQSVDGGVTWVAGVDSYGNAVMNTVAAKGISADWITTGAFAVRDNNTEVFYADKDTGAVRINGDKVTIASSNYAEQKSIAALLEDIEEDFGRQVDGKIDTYYSSTDPSTGWSDTQKATHYGDIWYNTSEGKSYMYRQTGWGIMKTEPPQSVYDIIDGHAVAYYSSAVPAGPYNTGDIWFKPDGTVYVAKVDNAQTTQVSSDWLPMSYTDDSALDAFKEELDSTEAIFDRLTQNGTVKGIFIRDVTVGGVTTKQLFFSFDYAEGGTLKLGRGARNYGTLVVYGGVGSNGVEKKIVEVSEDYVKIATEDGWDTEYIDIQENVLRGYSGGSKCYQLDFTANTGSSVYTSFWFKTRLWLELGTQANKCVDISSNGLYAHNAGYYLNETGGTSLAKFDKTEALVKSSTFAVDRYSDGKQYLKLTASSGEIDQDVLYVKRFTDSKTLAYLDKSFFDVHTGVFSLYNYAGGTDEQRLIKATSNGLELNMPDYSFFAGSDTKRWLRLTGSGATFDVAAFTANSSGTATIKAANAVSISNTAKSKAITIQPECGNIIIRPRLKNYYDGTTKYTTRLDAGAMIVSVDTGPNHIDELGDDETEHYIEFAANSYRFKTYNGTNASAVTTMSMSRSGVSIAGELKVNGTVINSSDRRLKKNIAPYNGDIIDQLAPVSFDWKGSHEHVTAGLIAQDVMEVCPELVRDMGAGYLGINYQGIVPHLIAKAKKQQETIDSLEKRISRLEKLVERLMQE